MKKKLLLLFLMASVCCYAQQRDKDWQKIKRTKEEVRAKKREQWDNSHPSKKSSTPVWLKDLLIGEQSLGGTYNYGKYFPYGASVNYSYSLLMLSLDFGINNDGDKYYSYKESIADNLNYTKKTKSLDPKFFITVTPSFYMKYFAVGCGVGLLCMTGKENKEVSSGESVVGEHSSSSHYSSYSTEESAFGGKLMIRPSIKGFIPLTDDLSLSLSAGYDYIFKLKEKNGFNFGIGLQCVIDY